MNLTHSSLSYWEIWLSVFARQLCLPVPALLFLMAAGALAAHGRMNIGSVLLMGLLGCLAGDGVWFWLGRQWGSRIVRLVCRFSNDPTGCTKAARSAFDRWGLRSLVIAKFVPGLDAVTPPLAGAEGSTFHAFLAFDSVGSFLWSAMYTVLGFVFADQLEAAIVYVERFGKFVAFVVAVPLMFIVIRKGWMMLRMIRHLRFRQMTPQLLSQKIESGERIAVIDLRDLEDSEEHLTGIPGAVRIDPVRLKSNETISVPEDVKIVLYCSSRKDVISARTAIALRRRGISNVWVLDGGLASWRRQDFATTALNTRSEELAERLGIELPHGERTRIELSPEDKRHPISSCFKQKSSATSSTERS